MNPKPFSPTLQKKIDLLKAKRSPIKLGAIDFDSPLLLAPMSAICNYPFRLLMEELGAGGTVSELISCHGINYGNKRTREMLYIHPREKNIGIQLFGEDPQAMAESAKVAQEYGPKFIDINMGCPVRKVVSKGGGSALLKDTKKLAPFFALMKKSLEVPLTIKIRTGWDVDSINAPEIIHIAKEEGVEFVAIHGRTRTQQYKGEANWDLLEMIGRTSPLPIIGNGDLHTAYTTQLRMKTTACQALMLGRGCLRNPFIFLESYLEDPKEAYFSPDDYWEIILRYFEYLEDYATQERTLLVQMRKLIVWFVAGFPGVAKFRGDLFKAKELEEVMKISEEFFKELTISNQFAKNIDHEKPFMAGGHG
ncbi:MAG: tRNA dihydrouridine synthase DusB [Oligoflexia bacterium]|nr:tRNA dihydrouridine synthase DusB [Oligoflexia bacterium]